MRPGPEGRSGPAYGRRLMFGIAVLAIGAILAAYGSVAESSYGWPTAQQAEAAELRQQLCQIPGTVPFTCTSTPTMTVASQPRCGDPGVPPCTAIVTLTLQPCGAAALCTPTPTLTPQQQPCSPTGVAAVCTATPSPTVPCAQAATAPFCTATPTVTQPCFNAAGILCTPTPSTDSTVRPTETVLVVTPVVGTRVTATPMPSSDEPTATPTTNGESTATPTPIGIGFPVTVVIDGPTPTSTPVATIGPVGPCDNLTAVMAVRIRESPTRPSSGREGFFDVFTEIAPPGDPTSSFFDIFYGDLDIMRKCGGDPQSLRSFFDVFVDPLMKASEGGALDSFFDVFTELPMAGPSEGTGPDSFFDVFTELMRKAGGDPQGGEGIGSFFDVFFDVFQPGGEGTFFDVFFDVFTPDQKASFFDVFTEFALGDVGLGGPDTAPSPERRQHAPVVFIKEWTIVVIPAQAPMPMEQ